LGRGGGYSRQRGRLFQAEEATCGSGLYKEHSGERVVGAVSEGRVEARSHPAGQQCLACIWTVFSEIFETTEVGGGPGPFLWNVGDRTFFTQAEEDVSGSGRLLLL
jgi:hypothetical protein